MQKKKKKGYRQENGQLAGKKEKRTEWPRDSDDTWQWN